MGRNKRVTAYWAAMVTAMVLVVPVAASANDAGVSNGNFAESRGCLPGISGPNRPFVSRSGSMSVNDQIRGPWGDMFGRTYYQVSQSLVDWRLPGSSKTMRVHERLLPALQQVEASLNQHLAAGKYYNVYSAFAWVWRTVGGAAQPSEHSLGSAFDINPSSNPYSSANQLITNMPDWFVDSFVDAGFCWGGNWVDVKDAMHFSWSGPAQTPNYPGRPAPYPPVTSATNYTGAVVNHMSRVLPGPDGATTTGDITGEGAPDLIKVFVSGRVEAAGALGDYAKVAYRSNAGTGSEEATVGDYDLDGRADVWVPDTSGSTIRFDIWTHTSDFESGSSVPTAIPSSATKLLLGMYDDDFIPDVYALNGSTFDVYSSKSGFTSVVSSIPLPAGASASWHLATGEHDHDGKSDVYAISDGSSPELRIRTASGANVSFPGIAAGTVSGAMVDMADYDGDGREDIFVLNGSSLSIVLGGNSYGDPDAWFQRATSIASDAGPECVGSSSCDSIGHVDPGGVWTLADRPRTSPATNEFYFGNPVDVPFSGDWDCDTVDSPGLYRQSDGYVYLRATNTQGVADREFFFGNPGDVPLVGDFNGDGCDTVSIFRPSEHRMYIINELGNGAAGLGAADFFYTFGDFGDIPFVGDFDGNGVDEIGLHRGSTGQILLRYGLSGGTADASFPYGAPGDDLFAGDWNGDGIDTVAVYRPSNGNWYVRLANTAGFADHTIHFHNHGQTTLPVSGRFGF
jgi:hypothetical protein